MKILKIENNQGFYSIDGLDYVSIDKINKDYLLQLADLALKSEVTFDEYSEDMIRNQAHQIIYKSLYEKLTNLYERKDDFMDESKRLFLQEYEKYKGSSSA